MYRTSKTAITDADLLKHASDVADRLGGMVGGARVACAAKPAMVVGRDGLIVNIRFTVDAQVDVDAVMDRLREIIGVYERTKRRAVRDCRLPGSTVRG